MQSLPQSLRPFEFLGIKFEGSSGDQYFGTCPFSGKSKKFYVNSTNQLWDSKVAGQSGNLNKFLSLICQRNEGLLTPQLLAALAKDRGLPPEAFGGWGVGYYRGCFTLPVKNETGKVVNILVHRPGSHMLSVPGCPRELFGADDLEESSAGASVFVCEGEWDTIALRWFLRKMGKKSVVVGVPGAAMFKESWVPLFKSRSVFFCYDNDKAGRGGQAKAIQRLEGIYQNVVQIHWPEGTEEGYDVRDWIKDNVVGRKKSEINFEDFTDLMGDAVIDKIDEPQGSVAFKEVEETYRKWLHLDNTDGVRVAAAVVLSNRLNGDPVWLFIVAPPGGTKTETVVPFAYSEETHLTSTLTSHSLISGLNLKGNRDPSLIPKLNGKTLLIKDFTAIIGMSDQEKDSIFGTLRDAYDGKCGKVFGNGVTRNYDSKFSVLAAVTPAIYAETKRRTALGERFLKFSIQDPIERASEDMAIRRAIGNVTSEIEMREELGKKIRGFLLTVKEFEIPKVPQEFIPRFISLARYIAQLRAVVPRDKFRNDILEGVPSVEMGTRLAKQLIKLGMSLAILDERKELNEDDYRILKKVARDTAPPIEETIVRKIYKLCPHEDDSAFTSQIVMECGFPTSSVVRVLGTLQMTGVVVRIGTSKRHEWQLSKRARGSIDGGLIYADS